MKLLYYHIYHSSWTILPWNWKWSILGSREYRFYNIHMYYPVKNVTWIPMEIPCHFMSQIDSSLVQIDPKFHDYCMSFIQVLFVFHAGTWHGFWIRASHGISEAFAKKMMGFLSDLVLSSNQTKLPSKSLRKSMSHFLQGIWTITHRIFSLACMNKNVFTVDSKQKCKWDDSISYSCTFVWTI